MIHKCYFYFLGFLIIFFLNTNDFGERFRKNLFWLKSMTKSNKFLFASKLEERIFDCNTHNFFRLLFMKISYPNTNNQLFKDKLRLKKQTA